MFETAIIGITAVLYISVGVSYAMKGNYPWCIIWLSYGLANCGLIWASLTKVT